MPEFILPAEADRCPHCGAVLRDPPRCCEPMRAEADAEHARRFRAMEEQQNDWD